MDRQIQMLNEKYQRLHHTGKRLQKIKNKNYSKISSNTGSIIHLNQYIKLDCSGLTQDLKVLLFDIIKRGYHPLNNDNNKYQLMKDKKYIIIQQQAINIIWGCLGRQLGKTFIRQSILDVKEQMMTKLNNVNLMTNLQKHQYIESQTNNINLQKYNKLIQQRNIIKKNIQDKLQKVIMGYNIQEPQISKQKYLISKILQKDIIQTENYVFQKSLVGIQIQKQQAILIFQQCYPNIKMDYNAAKQYVGQTVFRQKVKKYKHIKQRMKSNHSINFCHFCLQPILQSQPKKCDNRMARQIIQNLILTDPFVYYQNVLCQYIPKFNQHKQYIHPYLKYYKISKTQKIYLCNRYICNECFTRYYTGSYGSCEYCEGSCDCPRCSALDYLTKAIGLYFLYSQQSEEAFSIFQKFKFRFENQCLNIKSGSKNNIKQDRFNNLIKSISFQNKNEDWLGRYKYEPKTSNLIKQRQKVENNNVVRQQKKKRIVEKQKQKNKSAKIKIKEKQKKKIHHSQFQESDNIKKNIFYDDSES